VLHRVVLHFLRQEILHPPPSLSLSLSVYQVKREIKNSKKCYYIAKFSKGTGNPKEMRKTINSIKGRSQKDSTISEITVDETHSTNNRKEIADFINNHFTNIGPQLAFQLPNPTKTST